MNTTRFEDSVNELSERVRPQLEAAKRRFTEIQGRVLTFIEDHPAACLLGAAALGYFVARLARRYR